MGEAIAEVNGRYPHFLGSCLSLVGKHYGVTGDPLDQPVPADPLRKHAFTYKAAGRRGHVPQSHSKLTGGHV
jgi:hypothetical protein